MSSGTFTVNVGELEDGPKELQGALPKEWVRQNLKDAEIEPAGDTDGTVDVVLTKNESEVLVQGSLDVTISVPCARTLDPAIYRLRPEVFLMLAPAGAGEAAPPNRQRSGRGKKAGKKGTGKKGNWDQDPELSDEVAAQDTYSGDKIVLDGFFREFILLEVPMLPLREDLRDKPFEANPPLPDAGNAAREASKEGAEEPIDPRLSPLRDLKARLEKKE